MEGLDSYLAAMTEGSLNGKVGHWLMITDQNGRGYGPMVLTGFSNDAGGRRQASFSDPSGGSVNFQLTEIASVAETGAPAAAQPVQTVVYEAPWGGYGWGPSMIYGGGGRGGGHHHHGHHGIGTPYVVPIFTDDKKAVDMYRNAGWMVVPVQEAIATADGLAASEGLGSFWSGLWGGIAWPFKTAWKGASWLAVQPIHGIKWVWNEAKGQYEMSQTQETEPAISPAPTTIAGTGMSTSLIVGVAALGLWLLYVTWKKKPLVPEALSSGFGRGG